MWQHAQTVWPELYTIYITLILPETNTVFSSFFVHSSVASLQLTLYQNALHLLVNTEFSRLFVPFVQYCLVSDSMV